MALTRFQNMQKFVPSMYKLGNNQMVTSIIRAWCQSDEEVVLNISETKNQLFVRLASANYLDLLGSNVGVSRPTLVPIDDDQYREYILAAGYKPKTVRKLIYELLDIFWGETKSRSTVTSTAYETFNFTGGPYYLNVKVNNDDAKLIKLEASDFATPGSATAQEVCDKINYILGDKVTAQTLTDSVASRTYVQIYTNTPGLSGSIQILPVPVTVPPTNDANTKLVFPITKVQSQEVTVIELYPNHIILKIPSDLQINSSLKGSHYFHPDATIIDPRPLPITTAAPFWPGGFLYDYNNIDTSYSHTIGYNPTSFSCLTTAQINIGSVINQIAVDDNSDFPDSNGYVIFNYGHHDMEKVKYTGRISTPLILGIDPTHVFTNTWPVGTPITLLEYPQQDPRGEGSDYPIYFIDPQVGQALATQIVTLIKAAGVILEFDVKTTSYLYDGTDFSWYNYTGGGGGTGAEAWFQPPRMNIVEETAMVAAWGVADRGKVWYNTDTDQLKMWSGSNIVILG